MSKVIVYLRVSTDGQDTENQKIGVVEFCRRKEFTVDKWVEDTVSGGKSIESRKLGGIIKGMKAGDILIAAEISRLSRNMLDLMGLLQNCMQKGIRIYTVKEGYELGDNINSKVLAFAFGLAAEIERTLLSARIKEALARLKASGVRIGRPPGARKRNPILLQHADKIADLVASGATQKAIAKKFKVHRHTVKAWVEEHINQTIPAGE